jgi:iron complex transport system substrate-binding protein
MQAAGHNSYIGDMIKAAGGDNIITDMSEFPVVNSETVLNADPDVIVISYPLTNKESIANRSGWQTLRAVRNKQIYALDQDLLIRPGPRNLEALELLRNIFTKAGSGRK